LEGEKSVSNDAKVTRVVGRALPVRGNDIDTDRIIPARYLKEVTFARMGEYPFFDERFDASGKPKPHPFNDGRFKGASILFVNKNFGCGSSREHAPQALYRFGIRAIVGDSFAAIFAGNCVMMGLPCVVLSSPEIEELMRSVEKNPETVYSIDLEAKTLVYGNKQLPLQMPETSRNALITGSWDSTSLLHANMDKVKKVAAGLPYMSGFKS
jgi:3-isopropylmalate/(R)-2-methylmalate dehydratase small subunit